MKPRPQSNSRLSIRKEKAQGLLYRVQLSSLFGLRGGITEDFIIVNDMILELAKRLDTGGVTISCIAHVHRDRKKGMLELNNLFLEAVDVIGPRFRLGMYLILTGAVEKNRIAVLLGIHLVGRALLACDISISTGFSLRSTTTKQRIYTHIVHNEPDIAIHNLTHFLIASLRGCCHLSSFPHAIYVMVWLFKTIITLQLLASIFSGVARASDLDTIYARQIEFIVSTTPVSSTKIKNYVNTLKSDGSWSAIDYSAGCTARRSSWPAGGHWTRLLEMAVAYRGGVARYKHNADLRLAIQKAMGYWFANDYSVIGDGSCMDREFLKSNHCPCGTPGLWGPNWYSNVIQVPSRAGKACVLLRSELTSKELAMCTLMTARAYAPFYRDPQPGYLSGANVMDIAVIGILAGLLENNRVGNVSRIADAYERVHEQALVQSGDRVDGIKPDGSFQQHGGIIYNGNYGKDFSNSFMELELQALGTQFQADKKVQDSFAKFFEGGKWMTYTNVMSKVVHWDLTIIGRFISYPVADGRASANLRMDLSHVLKLGNAWSQKDLIEFGSKLTGSGDNSANSGGLIG
ncbi:unnamed protein product, partial [Rhizoctonia solani]